MSKRKRRRKPTARRPRRQYFSPDNPNTPHRFAQGMAEVDQLMQKKQWQPALEILHPLARRYPGQPDLLTELVNVYYELGDIHSYQATLLRLLKIDPDNDDAMYGLAGSYIITMRPVLALRTLRECLQRWPNHEKAAKAPETIANLEAALPDMFAELDVVADEAGFALATQHEEMQIALSQREYHTVRKIANAILKNHPRFSAAHNNLSLAYWMQGDLDRAIETTQALLKFEPDNVHALSNLIHFLYMRGRVEEAQSYAEPLRTSPAPAAEKHLKQMEGCIFLEDYVTVAELFTQAQQHGELDLNHVNPMYYHLAAVAALHLGDEKQARQLWQQALQQQQSFQPAQENLADLKLPVGERNGPYAYPLNSWVSQQALKDLEKTWRPLARKSNDRTAASLTRMYLRKHPEMLSLFPILLKRGDSSSRKIVITLAKSARTPETLAALQDFAFSSHGSDKLRMEVTNFLLEHGVIPSGVKRMYIRGEWKEDLLLMGFIVGDESDQDENFPPSIQKMAVQAGLALQDGDAQKAERILQKALRARPNSPGLLNNLAVAQEMQGHAEQARAMVREIHERFPDYLFARVTIARMAIANGELERARDLLDPLMQRRKLHFSEFNKMMAAFIELYLAEDNLEAARTWLNLWESTDPDTSILEHYQMRVSMPRLSKLLEKWP